MHLVNSQNLFTDEKLRDQYAKKGSIQKFKDSYTSLFTKEKDLNTAKFWNKLYYQNRNTFVISPVYKDKNNSIVRMIGNNCGSLLDVGFGSAAIEKLLRYRNIVIFGIDIAPNSVKEATKNLKGTFKVGNISDIPFTNGVMDFVLALDILEHLPTTKTFKAYFELSRVLKTGGKLIISVPLNEGLPDMLKKGDNPNGHLRTYTPNILRTELKLSGFRLLEERYLYAFRKYYLLKKFFINWFPFKFKQPNLMIILAQKK
jgi:SAM-dependent methyltransferase